MSHILVYLEETQLSFKKGKTYSAFIDTKQDTVAIFPYVEAHNPETIVLANYTPKDIVLATNFYEYLAKMSKDTIGKEDDPDVVSFIVKDCIEYSPTELLVKIDDVSSVRFLLDQNVSLHERLKEAQKEKYRILGDLTLIRAMDANPHLYQDVERPVIMHTTRLGIDKKFEEELKTKQMQAQILKEHFANKKMTLKRELISHKYFEHKNA